MHLGQNGESACFIWKRCLLRLICPEHSCIVMEACVHDREVTSFSHLLDGVVLSTALVFMYLGDAFQHQIHFFWILDLSS